MPRHLAYIEQGRSGYVVYQDGGEAIKMFYEFGGGDCVVVIYVPTPDQWTATTHRPIAERQAILTFVAEQVVKDQAPNCYYKLSDKWIEIFRR